MHTVRVHACYAAESCAGELCGRLREFSAWAVTACRLTACPVLDSSPASH